MDLCLHRVTNQSTILQERKMVKYGLFIGLCGTLNRSFLIPAATGSERNSQNGSSRQGAIVQHCRDKYINRRLINIAVGSLPREIYVWCHSWCSNAYVDWIVHPLERKLLPAEEVAP